MDKQILNFTVNEQILVCENPIKISTNKVNYIQNHFDLGENWDGFDSVRAVWYNDFNCISTVLDSLGNCAVPFEVMKRKGNVKVNLVGSISDGGVLTDRLTSYPVVAVIVDCTAQIVGSNTSPITPSEFEQFAQRVHTDAERAEQGASNAETSAQNASDSATSARNSAESAHDDKIAIEEAIAEVIQQIEDFEQVQVVVNTLPPSSQATSDFTDGVLTLGIPQGVKGDTGNGIQSIAKTSTSGLVDTYRITYTDGQTTTFTVTNGAKGDTGNGIQSIAKTSTVGLVDTYTITYTNGNTTTFTVTNGEKGDKGDTGEVSLSELEQATVVQTLSDSTPYNYRRTNNGNGSGHREYDEIVGASVGWCQLVDWSVAESNPTTPSGITYTKNNDGSFAVNGTSEASGSITLISSSHYMPAPNGHVILFIGISGGSGTTYRIQGKDRQDGNYFADNDTIFKMSGTDLRLNFRVGASGVVLNNLKIYPQVFDLTLALGSTIADYVYSLEQSTAGSGVTWLKTHFPKLFDNGYQPYDSGSIKSVSGLTAHEMVGVNVWDEETQRGYYDPATGQYSTLDTNQLCSKNMVKCLPNTTYYAFNGSNSSQYNVVYYDANGDYLAVTDTTKIRPYFNATFVTPSDAHYFNFNLKTTYGTTYNHDICINLSDTSINGKYFPHEKHTYPLDSSVTLRGQYKLDANNQLYADGDVYKSDGSLNRNYGIIDLSTITNWAVSGTNPSQHNAEIASIELNTDDIVAEKYVNDPANRSSASSMANGCMVVNSRRIFITSGEGVDPSGYLVYKRATPTTETATPYDNPQLCDANGTEEYVSTSLVPIGHNTDYPMTLVDTMPSANGTYEPRVTVVNGVRTVTWVSV